MAKRKDETEAQTEAQNAEKVSDDPKVAEAHANVPGKPSALHGPSQDALNPAFAPPPAE